MPLFKKSNTPLSAPLLTLTTSSGMRIAQRLRVVPPVQDEQHFARNELLNPTNGSSASQFRRPSPSVYSQPPPSYRSGRSEPQQQEEQEARRRLFENAPAPRANFGAQSLDRPYDQYGSHREPQESGSGQIQDEDEEVEAIKQQIKFTKSESVASTRNALRAAREAEETARNTLTKLGDQTERIANTERALDMTKAYNDRAQDEAKEIQSLNQSIFRPNFSMNKSAKRDAAERRILDRHHDEREQREVNRKDVYDSRERLDRAFRESNASSQQRIRDDRYSQVASKHGAGASKVSGRGRYQFEADEEDDAMEQELDENLGEIGDLSKRLNLLARAAGDEVRAQNVKLGQLNEKTDIIDTKIYQSTQRLNRIK